MSQSALMQAAMQTLRIKMGLNEKDVDCVPEGMPPAIAPQTFYGIYDGAMRPNPIDNALDVTHGLNVAISVRLSHVPADRKGRAFFLSQTDNINNLAYRVIGCIHKSYDLLNLANQFIQEGGAKFGPEPLVISGVTSALTKSGDWWYSDPEQMAGIAMILSFFGARRIQYLSDLQVTM